MALEWTAPAARARNAASQAALRCSRQGGAGRGRAGQDLFRLLAAGKWGLEAAGSYQLYRAVTAAPIQLPPTDPPGRPPGFTQCGKDADRCQQCEFYTNNSTGTCEVSSWTGALRAGVEAQDEARMRGPCPLQHAMSAPLPTASLPHSRPALCRCPLHLLLRSARHVHALRDRRGQWAGVWPRRRRRLHALQGKVCSVVVSFVQPANQSFSA